jgi:ribosomal protein L22
MRAPTEETVAVARAVLRELWASARTVREAARSIQHDALTARQEAQQVRQETIALRAGITMFRYTTRRTR